MIVQSIVLLVCLQAWLPFQPSGVAAEDDLLPWRAVEEDRDVLRAYPLDDGSLMYFEDDNDNVEKPHFLTEKRRLRFHGRNGLDVDDAVNQKQEDKRRLRFTKKNMKDTDGTQLDEEKRRLRFVSEDNDNGFEKRRLRFHKKSDEDTEGTQLLEEKRRLRFVGEDNKRGFEKRRLRFHDFGGYSRSAREPRLRFHHLRKREASVAPSATEQITQEDPKTDLSRSKRSCREGLSESDVVEGRSKKSKFSSDLSIGNNLDVLASVVAEAEREKQLQRDRLRKLLSNLGKRSSFSKDKLLEEQKNDIVSRVEKILYDKLNQ